jgi:SET domain-containing protein
VAKPRASKAMFSLAPVLFRDSAIEGRGVFARKAFAPLDVVVPYAPKQKRVLADSPEANAAAETKLTLFAPDGTVIVPDTSVPGGWLCNHSCNPNAALYSSNEACIRSTRPIRPGEEVTIFYGWVTHNEPKRDPCRCGAPNCRRYINFDLSDADAEHCESDTEQGHAFRERFQAYADYLVTIEQEQVLDVIAARLAQLRAQLRETR